MDDEQALPGEGTLCPDPEITAYDAPPTGLVCITNLNPKSSELVDDYHGSRQMMAQSPQQIGVSELFYELNVESTAALQKNTASIASRVWL